MPVSQLHIDKFNYIINAKTSSIFTKVGFKS